MLQASYFNSRHHFRPHVLTHSLTQFFSHFSSKNKPAGNKYLWMDVVYEKYVHLTIIQRTNIYTFQFSLFVATRICAEKQKENMSCPSGREAHAQTGRGSSGSFPRSNQLECCLARLKKKQSTAGSWPESATCINGASCFSWTIEKWLSGWPKPRNWRDEERFGIWEVFICSINTRHPFHAYIFCVTRRLNKVVS